MDPITQGVLGMALPLCIAPRKEFRYAAIAGCIGGMAADLDIFIRSSADPLLAIQFHRHFTHSLAFVPAGSLIVATVLFIFMKKNISLSRLWWFAGLGYLTHAPLDACTSYGTMLFWPFSEARVAWDNIAVVDPLVTLPMGLLVAFSIYRRSPKLARIGLFYCLMVLGFGVVQRERAADFMTGVATSRGHVPVNLVTRPSILNLVLWRSIYQFQGRYYVDAVNIGFFSEPRLYEGSSLPVFELEKTWPELASDSQVGRDIQRFNHFSDGFLVLDPKQENFLGDLRYSLVPNSVDPLWGIVIDPGHPDQHVQFQNLRIVTDEKKSQYFKMLMGLPVK